MKILKDSVNDFFKWVKGISMELVELDDIDVSEDPVRYLGINFRVLKIMNTTR